LYTHFTEGFHGAGMGNKYMVTRLNGPFRIFHSRWMHTRQITKASEYDGLVKGRPQFHAVAITFIQQTGITFKGINNFTRFPTTDLILQRLWQIPVIHGQHRFDAMFQQQ
jgi:hypothetical protein